MIAASRLDGTPTSTPSRRSASRRALHLSSPAAAFRGAISPGLVAGRSHRDVACFVPVNAAAAEICSSLAPTSFARTANAHRSASNRIAVA